jgi:hypothetical protein
MITCGNAQQDSVTVDNFIAALICVAFDYKVIKQRIIEPRRRDMFDLNLIQRKSQDLLISLTDLNIVEIFMLLSACNFGSIFIYNSLGSLEFNFVTNNRLVKLSQNKCLSQKPIFILFPNDFISYISE